MIRDHWIRVRDSVADACIAAGRDPGEVEIVGAAKYVGPELTSQLVIAGCERIGENRPQVLWEKHAWFESNPLPSSFPQPQWHLIGHLQRNKVRRTLPMVHLIHSVDSLRLAQEISIEASRLSLTIPILLEVNVTADSSKTGMNTDELHRILPELKELPNLQVRGLMAMSTQGANSSEIRREFTSVRELRDELTPGLDEKTSLNILSMGMSGDFREAIAEGSTLVRIGSSLWEQVV